MSVTGDFAALRELAQKCQRLAGGSAVREFADVLAEEARELADQGFAGSHAPDGARWAPLKHRSGQPLRDTGRLQRSFTKQITGNGFTVRYSASYGGYHQSGTRRMVARKMLPDKSLPARWAAAFRSAAEEWFESIFGR